MRRICRPRPARGCRVQAVAAKARWRSADHRREAGSPESRKVGESRAAAQGSYRPLESTGRSPCREGGPVTIEMEIDRAQRVFAPVPVVEQGQSRPSADGRGRAARRDDVLGRAGRRRRLLAEAKPASDQRRRHARPGSAPRRVWTPPRTRHARGGGRAERSDRRASQDRGAAPADLSAQDARVRDYAIRVLADRRSPAAVPQLIRAAAGPESGRARRAAAR